jgi:hypothetical protein
MTFGEARQLDEESSMLAVRLTVADTTISSLERKKCVDLSLIERYGYLRRSVEHCTGLAVAAGSVATRMPVLRRKRCIVRSVSRRIP